MVLYLFLIFLSNYLSFSNGHEKGTLVFVEDESMLLTHSIFLDTISKIDKNTNITYASKPQKEIKLKEYNRFLYDNIVIMMSLLEKMPFGLSVANILEFLDQGGNMLLITDSRAGNLVRRLVKECGYEMLPKSIMMLDPVNFDSSDKGSRTVMLLDPIKQLIPGSAVFAKRPMSSILYQGSGFIPISGNSLVETLISSSETAYPDDLYDKFKTLQDSLYVSKISLVGAIKMRNDARASFCGSMDFFSNKYFNAFVDSAEYSQSSRQVGTRMLSGNKLAAEQLLLWTFKMQGVVKVSTYHHRAPRLGETLKEYNVEEVLEYTVQLQELKYLPGNAEEQSQETLSWVPYSSSHIQFEFVRIDPFIRQIYNRSKAIGEYTVTFKIPDIIGIYKLQTSSNAPGYNRLLHHTKVIVRPKKHDDFPRFVVPAWPHYATCIVMMVLSYLLMFLLVNYKEPTIMSPKKCENEDKKQK